jgi:DNA-directed RNA polymerase II subunit RPB3
MSLITDIKVTDNNNCSFVLNNVDKSLVNALRRTIMSDIPTFKFRTEPYESNDVNIIKNTCALHNEFLTHRIGMLPIHIQDMDSFDPEKYVFRINKKNDSETIIDVTTNDFEVFYIDDIEGEKKINSSDFFKPDDITKEYIVITKLKPDQFGNSEGEEIQLEAKLSVGTGKENAGYSPVSKVVFYNTIDEKEIKNEIKRIISEKEESEGIKLSSEEKQTIKKRFENFEAYRHYHKDNRGEPNKFNFEIESIGSLNVDQIMNKSIEIIERNINYFDMAVNSENADIEIHESQTVMDGIDIVIQGQGHTLGSIIQSYLFRNFIENSHENDLQFVGYKVPHPLKKEVVIRLQLKNPEQDYEKKKQILKEIIHSNTEKINIILSSIKKEWGQQLSPGKGKLVTKESSSSQEDSSSQENISSEKVIIKRKKKSSS